MLLHSWAYLPIIFDSLTGLLGPHMAFGEVTDMDEMNLEVDFKDDVTHTEMSEQ